MSAQIKFKRGSTWKTKNPVLKAGEPGVDTSTDTPRLKIGDGSTAWNNLKYIGENGGGSSTRLFIATSAELTTGRDGIPCINAIVPDYSDQQIGDLILFKCPTGTNSLVWFMVNGITGSAGTMPSPISGDYLYNVQHGYSCVRVESLSYSGISGSTEYKLISSWTPKVREGAIAVDKSTAQIYHKNFGTAGTYGSATTIPKITTNITGHITGVEEVTANFASNSIYTNNKSILWDDSTNKKQSIKYNDTPLASVASAGRTAKGCIQITSTSRYVPYGEVTPIYTTNTISLEFDGLIPNRMFSLGAESKPFNKLYISDILDDSGNSVWYNETSSSYILGNQNNDIYIDAKTAVSPINDNSITLGEDSIRWKSVWAQAGTIQTSDRSEKQDIKYIKSVQSSAKTVRKVSANSDISTDSSVSLEDIISFVENINPATFVYKSKDDPDATVDTASHSEDIQIGLIADDIYESDFYKYIGTETTFTDKKTNEVITRRGLKPLALAVTALACCKYLINEINTLKNN